MVPATKLYAILHNTAYYTAIHFIRNNAQHLRTCNIWYQQKNEVSCIRAISFADDAAAVVAVDVGIKFSLRADGKHT